MPFQLKTVQLGPRKAGIPWLSSLPPTPRSWKPQHGPGKALNQQALHGDSQLLEAMRVHPEREQGRQTAHIPGWTLCEGEALSSGSGSLEEETGLQKSKPDNSAFPAFSGHDLLILEVPAFVPRYGEPVLLVTTDSTVGLLLLGSQIFKLP